MASLVQRPNSSTYYIQFYVSGKLKRKSTGTDVLQVAKEMLRQFESAQAKGEVLPLPTRTPIASVVAAYVKHIRSVKTPKSAQTDIYYLRDAFGPICDELKVTSRTLSEKTKKRPAKPGQDRRRRAQVIEASSFEQVTTADVAAFISGRVESRGLAPKTANRYREILTRLFSWATTQHGVRMPNNVNPASLVERYRESAPEIRFLTLQQIDEQLDALESHPQMQTMVACLIYAGLRREELTWLTYDDIDFSVGTYGVIRVRAKTIGNEHWEPKTKRNRAVPISSQLRLYLDKWQLKGGKGIWLFPNTAGGRYDPDNFSSDLRALNTKAGLTWTNLVYRHTFGSQLAMKGVSLYKISVLMGNSPEICRRHYAALIPEELGDSVEFGTLKSSATALSA